MTCQDLHNLLIDYLGGDLHVEVVRTVEVHLQECQTCVTQVHSYRCTIRLARALPKCNRLPAAFEARLREILKPHLDDESNR
jgi:anti-sigma factor RsiW